MQVKGKNHMRAIDNVADTAMQFIKNLNEVPADVENIAISPASLESLCYGYIHLYTLMMEARQMPTPSNTRRFHTTFH